ncbi:MAG: hypothetical protein HGA54_09850 [Actinobacteria bacterium]|nr:hypothetical protein [Actinomycetota bacterium]
MKPIKFGALSLLLLVVAVILAILAMLSYSTAKASATLADKHASFVTQSYAAEYSGQSYLAGIDAVLATARAQDEPASYLADNLPIGTEFNGIDSIETVLDCGAGRKLELVLQLDEAYTYRITAWRTSVEWTPEDTIDDLWDGSEASAKGYGQ